MNESEIKVFREYCEKSAKMQFQAMGDPAKLELLAVHLTANGYNRSALLIMEAVLKMRTTESAFLNSAIIWQRNGRVDMAIKSLTNGIFMHPTGARLKDALIEVALQSHDKDIIRNAEHAVVDSKSLQLRRAIMASDDVATLTKLVSEAGSPIETMRCLDQIRLSQPNSLKGMAVRDFINRTAEDIAPGWVPLLEHFYAGNSGTINRAMIEAVTGAELFKKTREVFLSLAPQGAPRRFRLAQLTYPTRLTLVFEPRNDCLVKAVWTNDPNYLKSVANEHQILMRVANVPQVPKYLAHARGESTYVLAMSKLPGAPLILTSPASQAAFQQLQKTVKAVNNAGVAHNDLSPWNILIDGDKSYVIDFGAARVDAPAWIESDAAAVINLKRHFSGRL